MEDFFGTNIDLSELTEKAISLVMTYTPKLLLAILTLVVGLWLVNRFVNL
ncbi:mechanosensitive ion channel family protein, partial [Alteromonas sp.]|nr:mechanosensitive ion channel family protein [Alteromonas sp.]